MAKKYDRLDWKLVWKAFDILCEVVDVSWRVSGQYQSKDDWKYQSPQLRYVLTTIGVKIDGIQWRRLDRKFAEWYDSFCECSWSDQKKWIEAYITAGKF